jgi:hypothetical protein
LKLVTKDEMKKLIAKGYILNTKRGYVDQRGSSIGFYKTRNKIYIRDKYADIAKTL